MVEFYDHQRLAIEQLKPGSILCGGVGSGKSITSIGYFFIKECGGNLNTFMVKNPKDLYIITTAMKRDTHEWEKECERFHLNTDREKSMSGIKVTIDSWNNIKKYVNIENSFFIFDEQRVVGSGAWVKAFLKITKKNKWILLSATPGDTWIDYIPVFIANGFYKNRTEFMVRHVVWNQYSRTPYRKIDHYVEQGRLIRLRNQILVDMDYLKPAVSHHETIIVDYDNMVYKDLFKTRWNPFTNEPIKNAAELCYLLRRVVNSDPSRAHTLISLTKTKDRIIVFYNFDYELQMLEKTAEVLGIPMAQWNGHKHESIPPAKKWLYFVQYSAGAEGWNCVETDTMVFYSQNYSYRATVQAAGRIDRLNTPYKDLYFYHFRSNAGIDVAIAKALKQKKKFQESRFITDF